MLLYFTDHSYFPEVHEKLSSAEQRCELLERQLDHMRKLVHGAETKVKLHVI